MKKFLLGLVIGAFATLVYDGWKTVGSIDGPPA